MPNWILITVETLQESSVAAAIAAYSTAALAQAQEDRAPGLIQGVVNEVRGAVATCPANRLDANPASIPASLRDLAVDLILARLKKAVGEALSKDEVRDVTWRRAQLKEVSAGTRAVEQPDAPVNPEMERGGACEVVRKREGGWFKV